VPDRSDLNNLKARIDLVALIGQSVKLKQVGSNLMGICPFHPDQTASLSVSPQKWNCFGCEAGGDVVDWLGLKEKLEFPAVVARMEELAGTAPIEVKAKKAAAPTSSILGRIAEQYQQRFKECPEAQQYLKSRGLDSKELWETFRVGYCDGSLLKTMPTSGPMHEALLDSGILSDKGREHFKDCIVVPLEHPDFGVVGFYGRKVKPDAVSHLYLPGPKRGVLQWQTLKQAKRVHVTESVLDALSLWMAGIKDVTCLFSASSLHQDLETLIGRFGTPEIVLCLDGDRAGLEASQKHAETLVSKGIRCSVVTLPKDKDPNQILLEDGPTVLRGRALSLKALDTPKPAAPKEQLDENEDGFNLKLGEVSYKVTMIGPFVGRLRCAMIATRSGQIFTEKLDLHSQRNRAVAAGLLVRSLEIARTEAELHFNILLRHAMDWVDSHKNGDKKNARRPVPEMSDQERETALEFLRQPNLVGAILDDCEALGFVGEEKAKLLAYLIGLSRKLPSPLSGVVISGSGAGKSTLAEMLEQMTPPEDVLFFSRVTPQALYYMCHNLTGMLLLMEERAGGEAADYAIRTLQSRKKLKLMVPVKDPVTGQTKSSEIEVLGPIGYLETTTNPHLNPENSSRCFELFMDESPAQTLRIQAQQRLNRMLLEYDPSDIAEAVCSKHHNAQRLLESMRVVVPFADKLTFPSAWLRTRRDNERFLCLLEAITFLHQHQRQRGEHRGKPYVVATVDDYRLAYYLAREVLACTLHELSREAQELWLKLVPCVRAQAPENPCGFVFSFRDLRALTQSLTNYRLRSLMSELTELEYVVQVAGQNGKSFQFQLQTTETTISAKLSGLTTPDELAAKLGLPPFEPFEGFRRDSKGPFLDESDC
jgi:DNA primase